MEKSAAMLKYLGADTIKVLMWPCIAYYRVKITDLLIFTAYRMHKRRYPGENGKVYQQHRTFLKSMGK